MRFGVELPTCTAGMMHPVPFASIHDVVDVAMEAEQLGYTDGYLDLNLIGTPDQICTKVAAFAEAGLEHSCALLFVGNTVDEMRTRIRAFSRHVIPAFPAQTTSDPETISG